MTLPTIVQSGFGRSNSAFTVTLSSAPTAGNVLILLIAGRNFTVTPPAIFKLLESDTSVSFQGQWLYYADIASGTASSFSITGVSDWCNAAIFELDHFSINSATLHGGMSGASTSTITTGSLSAATDPSNTLRLLLAEWDNTTSATNPVGWTLLTPGTGVWQASTAGHSCAIWSIPATTSGTQSITMSGATNYPLYLDLQIISPPVINMIATQVGEEIFVSPTSALYVTQTGAEVFLTPTSALNATQIGFEVWRSVADGIIPPSGLISFIGRTPQLGISLPVPAGSIVFSTVPPRVDSSVAALNSTIIFNGFSPSANFGAITSSGSVLATGYPVTLSESVEIPSGLMMMLEFAPILGLGVDIPLDSMTVIGGVPTPGIGINVDCGVMTFTGFVPTEKMENSAGFVLILS